MAHPPTALLVASITAVVVIACETRPGGPQGAAAAAEIKPDRKSSWPESWSLEFGLRCASAGEDVRLCTCVANEVQKRWTPEQFESLGSEGLQAEMQLCRERLGGGGAR